jgi:hypothetical protein
LILVVEYVECGLVTSLLATDILPRLVFHSGIVNFIFHDTKQDHLPNGAQSFMFRHDEQSLSSFFIYCFTCLSMSPSSPLLHRPLGSNSASDFSMDFHQDD